LPDEEPSSVNFINATTHVQRTMTSFSQRKGLKPREKIVQIDSIDEELRN